MFLEAELKKAGLTDKEAAVYLASLSLGPSPVQFIARKAKVARATTYVVLENLMDKGLIARYEQGKKTMFVAEAPEQLLHVIDKRKQEMERYYEDINELIPNLRAFMKETNGKAVVRYYEGLEGLNTMRREMLMYSTHKDVWYNFAPADYIANVFGEAGLDYKPRITKGIRSITIFTTKSDELKQKMLKNAISAKAERKYISPDKYSSASGMTICRDRIAIGSFSNRLGGVVIESPCMSLMMKEFFTVLWRCLD